MSQRTEQVRKDRAKYLITEYRQAMQKLKLYTPLIEAFEQANDFETTDIDHYGITIKPKQAALSAKELSILFDEIIFDLPFEPKREILTENELSIYFGDYPLTYCISIDRKSVV